MEDADHLCSIVEDKKMLEQIKSILNLRREEDRMNVYDTTNTGSLQEEVSTTGGSNYDNSVTVVVDEDILNQAKEMFRLLREEEEMKMNQLNANAYSINENKDHTKPVKQIIELTQENLKLYEESNTPVVENAMMEFKMEQKLSKQDRVIIQTSTVITLETPSQHSDGNESETWKRRKTPHNEYHNTPTVQRRRKARNIEYNKPSKFCSEGFPLNWTNLGEIVHSSCKETASRHSSIRVILEPGKEEYDLILNEFRLSHVSFTQVERFQSTRNLEVFKFEMDCCRHRRGAEFDLGIMYLYLCTTEEVEKVCNRGLNITEKGPFGSGIYLSDNPGVCLRQIRRQTSATVSHMFKCRVIMGDVKYYGEGEYDKTLRREPRKENQDSSQWQYYDSVMGLTEDGLEVVVYEERRILIEYIIYLNTASLDSLSDESEC